VVQIIDRYIFRNIAIATLFVTIVLSVLVLLTQSLRFLELVVSSGASGFSFWILTALTLPKFLEIILPLGLMAAVLFTYNRLTIDSELIVLRSLGFSPVRLARPALLLSGILGIFLFAVMGWVAPLSNDSIQKIRGEIKAQMSALLFRDGIFNEAGKGLMVYIRDRNSKGELEGVLIHDRREENKPPVTIIAKSGVLVTTDEGQQVLVYNGMRQEFDAEKKNLSRLAFDQYSIDLPEQVGKAGKRWKEPEERSFRDLLTTKRDGEKLPAETLYAFHLEILKRLLTPFLVPAFTALALLALLYGPLDRRGQSRRILAAIAAVVVMEALYLGVYSLAKQSAAGMPLMVCVVFLPLAASMLLLAKGRFWDQALTAPFLPAAPKPEAS
jgi:lipopolysaccharide export system permease protein